jgi:hypothetical protein
MPSVVAVNPADAAAVLEEAWEAPDRDIRHGWFAREET